MTPLDITGTRTAPFPEPLTFNVGGELYPVPELRIKTCVIFPSATIGLS